MQIFEICEFLINVDTKIGYVKKYAIFQEKYKLHG